MLEQVNDIFFNSKKESWDLAPEARSWWQNLGKQFYDEVLRRPTGHGCVHGGNWTSSVSDYYVRTSVVHMRPAPRRASQHVGRAVPAWPHIVRMRVSADMSLNSMCTVPTRCPSPELSGLAFLVKVLHFLWFALMTISILVVHFVQTTMYNHLFIYNHLFTSFIVWYVTYAPLFN